MHSDVDPAILNGASGTVALVYDFLLVPGGAEQVTLHALDRNPDWRLVTGFVNRPAFADLSLPERRIRTLSTPARHPALQALRMLRAFERKGQVLADFDRVLFSGAYAPVGVRHRPRGGNACYCHTPPRFAYDLEDWYLSRARAWERPLLRRLARDVRDRYDAAMRRMDRVAANSETVRERLQRLVGLDRVEVIHPPVDTSAWSWRPPGDYYLSTARLEPYKRVEWAVRAFMGMPDRKLVVASGGSEERRLRALADGHDNIRFTGWCGTEALRRLVADCIATLYLPRDEDFGLSPVESMAAGKPVIGIAEGGLRETVLPGETGLLLPPDAAESAEALRAAVRALDRDSAAAMRTACERRARHFDADTFDRALRDFVGGLAPGGR